MKYDVYGIGNALVDIQAQVDEPFLKKIEQPKGIMTLVDTPFQARLLEQLKDRDIHTVGGGSAANTIIGIANLGGNSYYAGKVGEDDLGSFYTEDLKQAGVHHKTPLGKEPTGTSVILITPDAQRSMFTHLGANIRLAPEDIDEEAIKNSKWVYIEGYLWYTEGPRAAAVKVMEIAKKNGVQVAYSFSDPVCVKHARADLHKFTEKYVDLIFCNEDEALAFSETENISGALGYIQELKSSVAITSGPHGSHIYIRGETHRIPSVPTEAIDTTGAGDLYAAGVLYGLTHDYSAKNAGKLGSYCASRIVNTMGPRLKEKINPTLS